MRKKIGLLLMLAAVLLTLPGCEALFTKSLFTAFAADPSEMTPSQLEVYAQGLLGGGDTAAMAEAFTALEDNLPADAADDPELYLLATDLAMGGSGLSDVMLEVADMALSGDMPTDPAEIQDFYETTMENLDVAMLTSSVDIFTDVAAVPGADISESQYANAAAAMLIVLLDEAGNDPDAIDTDPATNPDYALALDWAALGGIDIAGML